MRRHYPRSAEAIGARGGLWRSLQGGSIAQCSRRCSKRVHVLPSSLSHRRVTRISSAAPSPARFRPIQGSAATRSLLRQRALALRERKRPWGLLLGTALCRRFAARMAAPSQQQVSGAVEGRCGGLTHEQQTQTNAASLLLSPAAGRGPGAAEAAARQSAGHAEPHQT